MLMLLIAAAVLGIQDRAPANNITIDLPEAIRRAQAYSPQFQIAATNATLRLQELRQAKAARLPTVDALNQFIYTEGNGTPSGVFVANDGVHVYNEQAIVRENLFSLVRRGAVDEARAAEAVALAQKEIAARGLVYTVVQDYYNVVSAQRKLVNAQAALDQAQQFVDITQKQEQAGDVSHVDVVKADLQYEQRSRDLANAKLALSQASLALGVLLFPNFDQNYSLVDDLATLPPLASWEQVQALALRQNPEIRSAQASLRQAHSATTVARYGYLPGLDLEFFYGIDANQFAAVSNGVPATGRSTLPNFTVSQRQNLGYSGQATLDIPVWNWGITHSKVKAAEIQKQLAEVKLAYAERRLRANLRSVYQQAETAQNQVSSLLRSRNLAAENLHLTLLRYEAGDATALEVVSAQDASVAARSAYDDGLSQYHVALADLQTFTGAM